MQVVTFACNVMLFVFFVLLKSLDFCMCACYFDCYLLQIENACMKLETKQKKRFDI